MGGGLITELQLMEVYAFRSDPRRRDVFIPAATKDGVQSALNLKFAPGNYGDARRLVEKKGTEFPLIKVELPSIHAIRKGWLGRLRSATSPKNAFFAAAI